MRLGRDMCYKFEMLGIWIWNQYSLSHSVWLTKVWQYTYSYIHACARARALITCKLQIGKKKYKNCRFILNMNIMNFEIKKDHKREEIYRLSILSNKKMTIIDHIKCVRLTCVSPVRFKSTPYFIGPELTRAGTCWYNHMILL